ncbi:MAG TPA: 2-oxoacid:acceptor oxidoreductase subunit alpha [Candidatus Thermoplasmatota archaeon]|nr:2-oxoacid:acceptor oxidoreductase subunit alpha [Candidatus Thermoplasmatota archaeon]
MDRHGVAWLIAGTAGEGLESGGETFARALAALGYRPTTQRDFPSRIRGGDTTFTVRLTPDGRLVPPERIDLALAFNDTVLPRIDARMHGDGLLLLDEGAAEAYVPKSGCDTHQFPFTALASKAGLPKAKNMVALGASAALLGVDLATLGQSVLEQFGRKGEKVAEQNLAAMQAGHAEAVARFGAEPRFPTPTPSAAAALFLSGNEACALGALAAGCRVAAAYPITPASDILEYLTPRLQALGGTALQMEDELAAVNILVGAGFTGAKALTATSGPGLSLMTEAIGLAGSAETPCVIVDCQRPGPSTGMPTKHGQEDLWQMVHGGHGEFVRVVLSPVDVADAFHATSEAFRLAERFRCPAFVALDQQASLFKQTVAPFDVAAEAARHAARGPNPAPAGSHAWEPSYSAYGDTGAQPHRVALPGEPGGRYYSNSTEHSPNGFTTEDPATRVKMVDRRLARLQAIVADTRDPLLVEGAGANDADLVLVSWGSTVEACREASHRLLRRGVKARVVGVRLLWPFPREAFQQAVGEKAPIHVVEANAFAQLARLIRSELPLHGRMRSLLQYDGRTIASDAILAAVAA